ELGGQSFHPILRMIARRQIERVSLICESVSDGCASHNLDRRAGAAETLLRTGDLLAVAGLEGGEIFIETGEVVMQLVSAGDFAAEVSSIGEAAQTAHFALAELFHDDQSRAVLFGEFLKQRIERRGELAAIDSRDPAKMA